MIHAKLTGAPEAVAGSKEAAKKAKAALKSAVFKVVRVGAKTAKRSLIRNRTGLLAKAIGSKVKVYGERVMGFVGVKSGFRTTVTRVKQGRGDKVVFEGIRGTDKNIKAGKGKKTVGTAFADKTVSLTDRQGKVRNVTFKGLKAGDVVWPGEYGKFIEFGHVKGKGKGAAKAFPFIRTAFDETKQTAPAQLTQELQSQVGK